MTGDHIEMNDLERLAAWTEESSATSAEFRQIKEHLRACPECAGMAETYAKLRRVGIRTRNEMEGSHPTDEEWFAYAAGIAPVEERAVMLRHAGECASCAAQLKAVLEDFEDLPADEELRQLRSSAPAWQRDMAAHMVEASGGTRAAAEPAKQSRGEWWRRIFAWRPLPLAAAAVVLVAVGMAVGIWFYRQGNEEALLAQASNQRRVTDLYLPGTRPRAVDSPTLGQSDGEDVLPLLKLKERVREHLDKTPNDAYWQQVDGRIALAEGNGSKAARQFELASALNPGLKEIKFDLAEAHFEVGDAEQKPLEYTKAAELFGQVIDDATYTSLQSAAYYNRALCWERLAVYPSAIEDYEKALALEKDSAWRRRIEKRLADVKAKAPNSEGKSALELDTSPEGFLQSLRADSERTQANYEIYFDHASREWLRSDNAHAGSALRELAKMGLAHHDAWLTDLLDNSRTPAARAGIEDLTAAIQANFEGNADLALRNLTSAEESFIRARNTAGVLRTRAEMIYTFQRMGRSDECLRLANSHPAPEQLKRYTWLNAYQFLEVSICSAARGDLTEHLHKVERSMELSRAGRFPNQVLRERGMLVEILDTIGQREAALRAAVTGLRDCNSSVACSPMRVYQFEQSLTDLLDESKLKWAAADAARAAAHTSTLVANLQIRAYAQEVLGQMEASAGHTASANSAFSRASALLNTMPEGSTVALYRADWETDRSALLAQQGLLQSAIHNMQQAVGGIAATDNFNARQRFYTRFASLLLDAGQAEEARKVALVAVADAEHALASATSETERLAWEKTYGSGYRLLVAALAAEGNSGASLQAWEWYRLAPYRHSGTASGAAESPFASVLLPAQGQLPADTLIIVIARLNDRVVVWCIPATGRNDVRMTQLAIPPERAAEMAQTFMELCSDRISSEHNISRLGNELYNGILAPFQRQIDSASRISFDVDPSFERIPFGALVQRDGRYLNDTHELNFLPAWWTCRPVSPGMVPHIEHALVVEGAASLTGSGMVPSSTIPAEYFQTREVAAHFLHPVVLRQQDATVAQILEHLAQAEVFHYNGHTFSVAEETGLLLQPPDRLFTTADLHGVSMRQCRLAVLAACSSAWGAGEGMEDATNLTHAVLTAGAANVVATLWDVDAQASKTMMLRMYDLLAQSKPLPAALRQAQQEMRAAPATHHPYFWSSVQVFTQ